MNNNPADVVQITLADLEHIANSNILFCGRPILLHLQEFLEKQEGYRIPVEEFDPDNFISDFHAKISKNPQRFETTGLEKIENGQKIVSLLIPNPSVSQVLPDLIKPQFKYEDVLPRLLINDILSEDTARRLSSALSSISNFSKYDWIKSLSFKFAFDHLLYLLVFENDLERAICGCSSLLEDRLLTRCDLPENKLLRLRTMPESERIRLELRYNKPISSIKELLEIWDTFCPQFAASSANRDEKCKVVLFFSYLLPIPIPYDTIIEFCKRHGLEYDEPSISVPFRQSRLLDEIKSLVPNSSEFLGSFIIPFADFYAKNYKNAAIFKKCGEYWIIAFAGQMDILPNTIGLAYIHKLIEHQGDELSAELIAGLPPGNIDSGLSPGLQMLSEDDRIIYQEELRDLKFKRRYAEAKEDDAAVAGIDKNIKAIEFELRRSTNIYGRPRESLGDDERIRKAVSVAIKRSLKLIKINIPALERHFRYALKLGSNCSYSPDRTINWRL